MKKLKSILILLLLVVALVLVAVAGFRYFNLPCSDVKVTIADKNNHTMVSEQQARELIINSPANPVGHKVRSFDLQAIENALKQNPWVKGVESTSINGSCLTITIVTKTPLALVFPKTLLRLCLPTMDSSYPTTHVAIACLSSMET